MKYPQTIQSKTEWLYTTRTLSSLCAYLCNLPVITCVGWKISIETWISESMLPQGSPAYPEDNQEVMQGREACWKCQLSK